MKSPAALNPPLNQPLGQGFFLRPAPVVAQALLGKILQHTLASGQVLRGIIVETEAYLPENDLAAHGARGLTKLTAPLFQIGGTVYVHPARQYVCIDLVTGPVGIPSGVLLRALQPLNFTAPANGPGKLCRAMAITRAFSGLNVADPDCPLQVLSQTDIPPTQISTSPRIGITKSTDLQLRFTLLGNPHLSRC